MNGKLYSSMLAMIVLLCIVCTLNADSECASIKGISSNEFLFCDGAADTLWAVTHEGSGRYAVNTLSGTGNLSARMTNEANWSALYLCQSAPRFDRPNPIAYSSEMLVVCADSTERKPNDVYVLTKGNTISSRKLVFPWSDSIKSNEGTYVMAFDVTESNGKFYFACLDGGMVIWDSRNDSMRVCIPGMHPLPFSEVKRSSLLRDGKRIHSLHAKGDTVVVTTPEKIWIYNDRDSTWDSSMVTNKCVDPGITITSFESVFYNDRAAGVPLYGKIRVAGQGYGQDSLVLCKYNRQTAMWQIYMDEAPTSMAFGPGGMIYTVSYYKKLRIFIDTSANEIAKKNPEPLVDHAAIQDRMTGSYEIEYPQYINDLLYAPLSDSTGNIWIASSEGLFLSEKVGLSQAFNKCTLVKRLPAISNGLKKTYARPGIISTRFYDEQPQRTVFIYNLSKDANVTIRIYDFNMDHVKTVISGKHRKAGQNGGPFGRSTVESEDLWDGHNESGKLVVPGVYYYKITTDSGERAHGKIVVAK